MKNNPRSIEWLFAFISVVITWQLQLPSVLGSFAQNIGAMPNSLLNKIIVDTGIPLILALIVWITIFCYERLIWPWFPVDLSKSGWWIYILSTKFSESGNGKLEDEVIVVGCFNVKHTPLTINVIEGHAYYLDKGNLLFRGDWDADVVWANTEKLRILFGMKSLTSKREVSPSYYEGYIEVAKISENPIIGKSCWSGYFHDLGDRKNITGPFYAERLKYHHPKTIDQLKLFLIQYSSGLINKIYSIES